MIILSEISNNIHFIQISLSSMQRFLNVKALTISQHGIITVTKAPNNTHYWLLYITSIYF